MKSISKCYHLIIIISMQIHISHQLNFFQNRVKNTLVSSTEGLDFKNKMLLANFLTSVVTNIPIVPQSGLKMVTDILDEYKTHNTFNLDTADTSSLSSSDMENLYGNLIADKLQQKMSLEELNGIMKSIKQDEQSSKMSAARYVTIYLVDKIHNEINYFTRKLKKLVQELKDETLKKFDKDELLTYSREDK